MTLFTEVRNICGGTDVKWRKTKGSVWNVLDVRWFLDIQEEIQSQLTSLEVREVVQTGLHHFRSCGHTIFKAMGWDGVTLGLSLESEEERSKPWTPEHLEIMKSHQKGLKRISSEGRGKPGESGVQEKEGYQRGWRKHLCPWDQVSRE